MLSGEFDDRLRSAAFAYLDGLTIATGGVVSYKDLEAFESTDNGSRSSSACAVSAKYPG